MASALHHSKKTEALPHTPRSALDHWRARITPMADDLDAWCHTITGLTHVGDRMWAAEGISGVSFPDDGLAILAELEERSFWFKHRNRVFSAMMTRYEPGGRVFDIGGGNGFVSLGLSRGGRPVVVVEPDRQGAAIAHRRGLPVLAAAFQDLAAAPGTIPAAGLFDVLEHIEDEQGMLRDLHHALRPGGRLYIAVPAYNILWAEEDVHSGHFRRYTVPRLIAAVSAQGFRPEFATYFFAALVPAVFALRTIPFRLGRRSTHDRSKVARDHALPQGTVGRIIQRSLDIELARLVDGRSIPFGTSCLVVATK
jgi:2-polyprenyl-3-methyl-5-hydroxy-6-metoxy-1,4-benzoquinol methylase